MKERLDKLIVSRGLVESREMAKALILEGKVFVNGEKITKAGTVVSEDAKIFLNEVDSPYVSRGGLKLESAIDFFNINVSNRIIMDVGASTGGFTDCLLKMGAKKVFCIDVGYGQLAWSLRKDPRVIIMERTNVRYLDRIDWHKDPRYRGQDFEELKSRNIDMAVIDISFISLKKVISAVLHFLNINGEVLSLVKPQFEVGKGEIGRGGIVKEEEKRLKAVNDIQKHFESLGLKTIGVFKCPITGQKGNIEYFLYMVRL